MTAAGNSARPAPDGDRIDRAAGALLGLAAGDALGAGYEFGTPPTGEAEMIGGGLGDWEPGEWTDDTQMAVCVARVTAGGPTDVDAIAEAFLDWYRSHPADVGLQTGAVLDGAADAADLRRRAVDYHRRHPDRAAGNGSLMRTAPVALAHLGDDEAIAEHAGAISALTHADPLAGQACVLWCVAIDRAVREARLDGVRDGLALLDQPARDQWAGRLDLAEQRPPGSFVPNGFVVTALQAAHAAVVQTPVPLGDRCRHLQNALHAAVRIGGDTDTVAAIAGALLGARWGASAVPFRWRRRLHGWPGLDASDLTRLAVLSARKGRPFEVGWPTAESLVSAYGEAPVARELPDDPGVVVGNLAGFARSGADAVVSLCQVGTADLTGHTVHHQVWLMDHPDANPNLGFVIADAVEAVAMLRDEGYRVFLHCAAGRSRAPTVAAAYLVRRLGISGVDALDRVRAVLPEANPNPAFRALLNGLPST